MVRPSRSGLLLAVALVSPALAPAAAHKSANGWEYPPSCCSGDRAAGDCQMIDPKTVRESPAGYIVVLGPGDHRLVTRQQRYRIPYGQEITSPDGDYHICLYPTQEVAFCFFAPPGAV